MLTSLRRALHDRGHHRFCREIKVEVVDHFDFGKEWLVGTNPDGTKNYVDATAFGGRPVYRTEKQHG